MGKLKNKMVGIASTVAGAVGGMMMNMSTALAAPETTTAAAEAVAAAEEFSVGGYAITGLVVLAVLGGFYAFVSWYAKHGKKKPGKKPSTKN